MPFKIVVIYGSVRRERQGIRLARYLVRQIAKEGHSVTLLDPLELDLPLLDLMYKEFPPGQAPEPLERIAQAIKPADGFVVVSGEYNHGIPPALKNLLDHFLEEWFWRPSAIASYSAGSFGGVRAAVQLRSCLAEMGMPAISSSLSVPKVQAAFAEDGTPADAAWDNRTSRFLNEFFWHVDALAAAREKGTPY